MAQETQDSPGDDGRRAEADGGDAGGGDARDAHPGPVADADAALVRGDQPASTRVRLSRERVVAAAVEFIDTYGLPGLSMRRLGTMLGVEAMSLYQYVPGREQLLDAVVEHIVEGMSEDPDVIDRPERGWQDYLQRLAHGIRRVALAHPQTFPLVASRPAEAPWLRPPLRSLTWVEAFLDALSSEGFSDAGAVEAYRAFTSFLLGHLLLEVASLGADLGPLDVVEEDTAESLEAYPNVRRLSVALREDHSAVEFEDSLENLLQRLALIRSET
jgi:AcrR family transcriptional regulator